MTSAPATAEPGTYASDRSASAHDSLELLAFGISLRIEASGKPPGPDDGSANGNDPESPFGPVCNVRRVSGRDVVNGFWAAMGLNDWEQAASHLAPGCVIDWPCSGERIVGRDDFVAVQMRYPTNHSHWSFEVHRLFADGDTAVSEVTVTDGEQSARVVAFSDVVGEHIVHQVEYWPTAYDPPLGREDLTSPIERVP